MGAEGGRGRCSGEGRGAVRQRRSGTPGDVAGGVERPKLEPYARYESEADEQVNAARRRVPLQAQLGVAPDAGCGGRGTARDTDREARVGESVSNPRGAGRQMVGVGRCGSIGYRSRSIAHGSKTVTAETTDGRVLGAASRTRGSTDAQHGGSRPPLSENWSFRSPTLAWGSVRRRHEPAR